MREDCTLHLHRAHLRRAERAGTLFTRPTPFEDDLDLPGAVHVACRLLAHDDEGVASFRFTLPGADLGWATDAGRVTPALIDHLEGVDVLAIESNYCPRMQTRSGRPAFLIQRVMGGAGHLSNHECLQAVDAIAPREHVVLLHLSRDCNHPDLVADLHAGADYALTIAARYEPTRWINIGAARPRPSIRAAQSPAASSRPGAAP
jgi:phosphoribosyl 1,2-cyclic phosphodiesterase